MAAPLETRGVLRQFSRTAMQSKYLVLPSVYSAALQAARSMLRDRGRLGQEVPHGTIDPMQSTLARVVLHHSPACTRHHRVPHIQGGPIACTVVPREEAE